MLPVHASPLVGQSVARSFYPNAILVPTGQNLTNAATYRFELLQGQSVRK